MWLKCAYHPPILGHHLYSNWIEAKSRIWGSNSGRLQAKVGAQHATSVASFGSAMMTAQLCRVGARDEAGLCTNSQDPILAGRGMSCHALWSLSLGCMDPMRSELDCCGANEVGLSLCTQSISVRNAFQRWSRLSRQPRQCIFRWGKVRNPSGIANPTVGDDVVPSC
jgi:hypothetical protein